MVSKQLPSHATATPVTVFQHPIKLSLIKIQFQIMLNVVPKSKTPCIIKKNNIKIILQIYTEDLNVKCFVQMPRP